MSGLVKEGSGSMVKGNIVLSAEYGLSNAVAICLLVVRFFQTNSLINKFKSLTPLSVRFVERCFSLV